MKVGSALGNRAIGAGVGAAMGAGSSLYAASQRPSLADKVQQLQSNQNGGFYQAVQLAAAQQGLATAELAEKHPVGSAIMGGLSGAALGAYKGPGLASKAMLAGRTLKDAIG